MAIELAAWQAKEPVAGKRNLVLDETNAGLAQLEGFRNRSVYQSIENPLLLVDWVEWDSLEKAHTAVQGMMKIERLHPFVQQIEKTVLFEHYTHETSHGKPGQAGAAIELVVYQLKPEADPSAFQQAYNQVIGTAKGYQGRYILKNDKGENRWAEWAYWSNVEDAKAASAQMMQDPSIQQAFGLVQEVLMVHQYFRPF